MCAQWNKKNAWPLLLSKRILLYLKKKSFYGLDSQDGVATLMFLYILK